MHAMWQKYNRQCYRYIGVWSNCEVCECVPFLSGSANNSNSNNKRRQQLKTKYETHREKRAESSHCIHTICVPYWTPLRFVCMCYVCCLHFFTRRVFFLSFRDLTTFRATAKMSVCVRATAMIMWGFGHCVKPRHRNAWQRYYKQFSTRFLWVASLHVQCCLFSLFHTPHHSYLSWLLFFSYFFKHVVVVVAAVSALWEKI